MLAALHGMLVRHTAGLPLGTGDDVAVTNPNNARLVWTIDSMVEGTHFRWWDDLREQPEALGWKLVESNLSDLASKGATPRFALLSFGVPASAPLELIEGFYRGLDARLTLAECQLIGGDTVRAPQWTLTLTVVGELPPGAAIAARSGAKPGSSLYVTGWPGESGAGFRLLEGARLEDVECDARLVARHLLPVARLATGAVLVGKFSDLAMLDVSDGIAKDAGEIARASGVSIIIDRARLPISQDLELAAAALAVAPVDLALYGGEDYELLFATSASLEEVTTAVREADPGLAVHRIGHVEAGSSEVFLEGQDGERIRLATEGFRHFG